jgi:hypothetical protein
MHKACLLSHRLRNQALQLPLNRRSTTRAGRAAPACFLAAAAPSHPRPHSGSVRCPPTSPRRSTPPAPLHPRTENVTRATTARRALLPSVRCMPPAASCGARPMSITASISVASSIPAPPPRPPATPCTNGWPKNPPPAPASAVWPWPMPLRTTSSPLPRQVQARAQQPSSPPCGSLLQGGDPPPHRSTPPAAAQARNQGALVLAATLAATALAADRRLKTLVTTGGMFGGIALDPLAQLSEFRRLLGEQMP